MKCSIQLQSRGPCWNTIFTTCSNVTIMERSLINFARGGGKVILLFSRLLLQLRAACPLLCHYLGSTCILAALWYNKRMSIRIDRLHLAHRLPLFLIIPLRPINYPLKHWNVCQFYFCYLRYLKVFGPWLFIWWKNWSYEVFLNAWRIFRPYRQILLNWRYLNNPNAEQRLQTE